MNEIFDVRALGSGKIAERLPRFRMLIDGEWCESAGGWLETENPYLGKPWAEVPRATPDDVKRAVAFADRAFRASAWRGLSASARGNLLRRLGDLIQQNAERLAEIESTDNGKLISEMSGQLNYIPQWYHYFGGLADKIEGRVIPIDKPSVLNFTREEPLGVVAAITPWNSPLMIATWKLAPALAAGNTVVWKPSEFSSVSALEMGKLFEEAGFPPGVVNIVTGLGSEIGDALVEHPRVAKVTFTGGDPTGRRVYRSAADGLKPVTLELGGKSANIVFDDADFDNAVKGVVSGIFAATGQTCIAGSRALVHRPIYDRFVESLVALAGTAKMGNPLDRGTQIGPLTTRPQYQKVLDYIAIAKDEGARCVFGGNEKRGGACGDGWFIEPTIFADVRPEMRIAQEEVFGPILSIIPFDDEEEALEIANGTIYGLGSGIWSRDINRAIRVSNQIEAGIVWVNTYRAVSYMSPFGGVKSSGIGRESGMSAIRAFLQEKSVWIDYSGQTGDPFVMK